MPEYYYLTGLVTTGTSGFTMPQYVYCNTGTTTVTTCVTSDSANYYYYWNQSGLANQQASGNVAYGFSQDDLAPGVVVRNAAARNEELWQQWQRDEVERLKRVEVQRDEADKKAEALLHIMLDPEQREQFRKERYFEVITGGRRYRIKHGWAGNVFRLNEQGQETDRFCIHPVREIPVADNLVSQKLLLEANEAEFLRIANRTMLLRAA